MSFSMSPQPGFRIGFVAPLASHRRASLVLGEFLRVIEIQFNERTTSGFPSLTSAHQTGFCDGQRPQMPATPVVLEVRLWAGHPSNLALNETDGHHIHWRANIRSITCSLLLYTSS
jgi:hypothetical protein